MKYEFDYRLRQFGHCMRQYQKALDFMRDNIKYARDRRVYQNLTDNHYHWILNNVATWHDIAKTWYMKAQVHKQCLVSFYENAFYDSEAEKQYA